MQFVVFNLENQDYAIDIKSVNEINEMTEITKVPNSKEYIVGVINLRGVIIPIIDSKKKLNLVTTAVGKQVLIVEDSNKLIGLIIDNAKDVREFEEDQISSVDSITSEHSNRSIMKIINENNTNLISIINPKIVALS